MDGTPLAVCSAWQLAALVSAFGDRQLCQVCTYMRITLDSNIMLMNDQLSVKE